jgi:hypothetical protein
VDSKLLAPTEKRKPPNAGKGRVKGVPNKVTGDIRAMIAGALEDAGGQKYLARQAIENPQAFMGLVGRTVPKELNVAVSGALKLLLDGRGVAPAGDGG